MPGVRSFAKAQGGGLLCVLFVRIGAVPTHSGQRVGRRHDRALRPMLNPIPIESTQKDWARRPVVASIGWCLPIALGVLAGMSIPSLRIRAGVWAIALAWMGIACALNARRCHRLHCYIAAPILLLGAIAVGLLALDAIYLGPHALNNVVSGTFLLVLLSFVPEMIWGKYRKPMPPASSP